MTKELKTIKISEAIPFDGNTRRPPSARSVASLAKDIKANGLSTPILVWADEDSKTNVFLVISGKRRLAALKSLKATEIEAILIRGIDRKQAVELATAENLNRKDLHGVEQAEAFEKLVAEGHTVASIANHFGVEKTDVAQTLRLTSLPASIRNSFLDSKLDIPDSVFYRIARLGTEDAQKRVYEKIAASASRAIRLDDWEVDNAFNSEVRVLDRAPFNPTTGRLHGGACVKCPKATNNAKNLFPELDHSDERQVRCTDGACWDAKVQELIDEKVDEGYTPVEDIYDAGYSHPQTGDGKLKKYKLVVTAGRDRGKFGSYVKLRDRPSSTTDESGRRKISKEEKAAIEAGILAVGEGLVLKESTLIEFLVARFPSPELKRVEKRTNRVLKNPDGTAIYPESVALQKALIRDLLASFLIEPHGDRENALSRIYSLSTSDAIEGHAAQKALDVTKPWLDARGRFRKEALKEIREKAKAASEKAATTGSAPTTPPKKKPKKAAKSSAAAKPAKKAAKKAAKSVPAKKAAKSSKRGMIKPKK